MMITANIQKINQEIGKQARLIAVSKTKPESAILEAYEGGQRLFGENKVQEMTSKHANLPKDIEWHLIGHLQSNKVKYIAPFVGLIHSVDSLKLLEVIDKEGAKNNKVIACLLQVFIASEETKFGLNREELMDLLANPDFKKLQHCKIVGLMGMASYTENEDQVRNEFKFLKKTFNEVKVNFFKEENSFKEISMGMSNDYKIAIEEGATLIRVGSTIFGSR
jgi:pyridoxal phosphate enzyme (YggS family)